MSHPLRKLARAVQHETANDERPASYNFALNMLQKHWTAIHEKIPTEIKGSERRAHVVAVVVEIIRKGGGPMTPRRPRSVAALLAVTVLGMAASLDIDLEPPPPPARKGAK